MFYLRLAKAQFGDVFFVFLGVQANPRNALRMRPSMGQP